jgi:hypothetical protein
MNAAMVSSNKTDVIDRRVIEPHSVL